MKYGVRTFCDSTIGTMDISVIRKYWCGNVIIHRDDLGHQIFDMIPPVDFNGKDETFEFATAMVKFIQDKLGYQASVIKIPLN